MLFLVIIITVYLFLIFHFKMDETVGGARG